MVAAGSVKPIVHARFPLEQAAEAHRALDDGTHVGKVLLTVREPCRPVEASVGWPHDRAATRRRPHGPDDRRPWSTVADPRRWSSSARTRWPSPAATRTTPRTQERAVTDLVEQPAKVMRIGSMIRQLLDEVKSAPVDEASRARLAEIYASSIKELKSGLAPELVDELERLSSPFASDAPSEAELRVAQAQLVGWLEGLFHGIQTAIYAQQMAARAQLEQMRRALPLGSGMPGQPREGQPGPGPGEPEGRSGGMYL